jgi:hypothetical protein
VGFDEFIVSFDSVFVFLCPFAGFRGGASVAASFCVKASSSVAERFIFSFLDFSKRSLFKLKFVGFFGALVSNNVSIAIYSFT